MNRYLVKATIVGALGGLLFGFDTAVIAGTTQQLTIDTFHANIEEKNIPIAIESLGLQLKHVHLSENDRGLLGSGHVDFPAILRSLRRIGYSGYLMIEGFGYLPSELSAPGALWADPAMSPDMIAQREISYLKAQIQHA